MLRETEDKSDYLIECKQCHRTIMLSETLAYHLENKVLYGWCKPCFSMREPEGVAASAAAA